MLLVFQMSSNIRTVWITESEHYKTIRYFIYKIKGTNERHNFGGKIAVLATFIPTQELRNQSMRTAYVILKSCVPVTRPLNDPRAL